MLPMIGGIWFYRRTPAGIRVSVPFRLRPAISRDENPSVTEIHHKFVSRTKSGGSAYSDHLPRAQHFSFDISVRFNCSSFGTSLAMALSGRKSHERTLAPVSKRSCSPCKHEQSVGP